MSVTQRTASAPPCPAPAITAAAQAASPAPEGAPAEISFPALTASAFPASYLNENLASLNCGLNAFDLGLNGLNGLNNVDLSAASLNGLDLNFNNLNNFGLAYNNFGLGLNSLNNFAYNGINSLSAASLAAGPLAAASLAAAPLAAAPLAAASFAAPLANNCCSPRVAIRHVTVPVERKRYVPSVRTVIREKIINVPTPVYVDRPVPIPQTPQVIVKPFQVPHIQPVIQHNVRVVPKPHIIEQPRIIDRPHPVDRPYPVPQPVPVPVSVPVPVAPKPVCNPCNTCDTC